MSRSMDAASGESAGVNIDRARPLTASAGAQAVLARDPGAFVVKQGGISSSSGRDQITDRGAHQAGDAGQRGDEHPFVPHFLQDRAAEPGVERRALQLLKDLLQTARCQGRAGPEGQNVQVVQVPDAPLGIQRSGDDALTTEHVLMAEAPIQDVQMLHAVQQRQDEGGRARPPAQMLRWRLPDRMPCS